MQPILNAFRLTTKEIQRAETMHCPPSEDFLMTFVVRPQESGYLVAAVKVDTGEILLDGQHYMVVSDQGSIQPAIRHLSRSLEKFTGYYSKMTDRSRMRS